MAAPWPASTSACTRKLFRLIQFVLAVQPHQIADGQLQVLSLAISRETKMLRRGFEVLAFRRVVRWPEQDRLEARHVMRFGKGVMRAIERGRRFDHTFKQLDRVSRLLVENELLTAHVRGIPAGGSLD